jgi:hypothetical protein
MAPEAGDDQVALKPFFEKLHSCQNTVEEKITAKCCLLLNETRTALLLIKLTVVGPIMALLSQFIKKF